MKETPATILLIEDERQMRRFLRVTLQSEKYGVLEAETAADGLSQAATRNPDIVLLDLGLPDMDGLEVIEKLREWSAVPVIVISAREQEGDKIKALDRGADDYLTKPFGAGELLARIRAALRRAAPKSQDQGEAVFVAEELRIDFLKRQVYCGAREVHLTPIEYRLLTVLVRNAGRVMTHRQILKEVWGPPYVEQTHYLRVFMNQLRKKIEADSTRPHFHFLKRQVYCDAREVHLTPIEYRLLTALVRNAGRVMTHRQILKEVWGPPYVEQTHYLRVFMNQLRKKIETDSTRPRFLLNEPGIGYRFKPDLD